MCGVKVWSSTTKRCGLKPVMWCSMKIPCVWYVECGRGPKTKLDCGCDC